MTNNKEVYLGETLPKELKDLADSFITLCEFNNSRYIEVLYRIIDNAMDYGKSIGFETAKKLYEEKIEIQKNHINILENYNKIRQIANEQ